MGIDRKGVKLMIESFDGTYKLISAVHQSLIRVKGVNVSSSNLT